VPPKSELELLEEYLQKNSVDEAAAKLCEFSEELDEYRISGANVPAAKEQMAILEEKVEMCAAKISRDLEKENPAEENLEENLEGKGKETENVVDKGKGKEPENKYKGKGKEREG
jgi:hypothetical protein